MLPAQACSCVTLLRQTCKLGGLYGQLAWQGYLSVTACCEVGPMWTSHKQAQLRQRLRLLLVPDLASTCHAGFRHGWGDL